MVEGGKRRGGYGSYCQWYGSYSCLLVSIVVLVVVNGALEVSAVSSNGTLTTPTFPVNLTTTEVNGSLSRTIFMWAESNPSFTFAPLFANGTPSWPDLFTFDVLGSDFIRKNTNDTIASWSNDNNWVVTMLDTSFVQSLNFTRTTTNTRFTLSFSIYRDFADVFIPSAGVTVPVVPIQIKFSFYHYFTPYNNITGTFNMYFNCYTNKTGGFIDAGTDAVGEHSRTNWLSTNTTNITVVTLNLAGTQDVATGREYTVNCHSNMLPILDQKTGTLQAFNLDVFVNDALNYVEYDPNLSALFLDPNSYATVSQSSQEVTGPGTGSPGTGAGDGVTGTHGDGDGKTRTGLIVGFVVGGAVIAAIITIALIVGVTIYARWKKHSLRQNVDLIAKG